MRKRKKNNYRNSYSKHKAKLVKSIMKIVTSCKKEALFQPRGCLFSRKYRPTNTQNINNIYG